MIEESIAKYLNYFKKLNRGYSKNLGRAPHKPILLLSILQLIQDGSIDSNKIFITPELILAFKRNWKQLVDTGHTTNFSLPFFHLKSEPFWYLIPKAGGKISVTKSKSIKSFKYLKENLAYAEIDRELYVLLQHPISKTLFEQFLLDQYFASTKNQYSEKQKTIEESFIENSILNESSEIYQNQISSLRERLEEDEFEEEIFVRGGLFKRTIPKIYDYTCCISGLKIETSNNVQMVDACHIYPFSLSSDDTVPNGIALSPTMHRAFDRGLITINSDYIVRVSPIVDDQNSEFSITQFDGKQIMVPREERWFPSLQSLRWHNKEVFQL
ncbi:putative restriction endonuclease [Gramella sp. Hel_I_59]|uniref:HNH endonuclease n=1 Tax=Gramella sp. Hel_I_59 TaxID=1249978 RepID=UPI00116BC444|nr:HNH endonuclease [Gramella sp. Hel_I_59]TQI69576.1 putative restriction endonuclease [Gramella sp. Hel_I_59]